jgi:hypothetical protein
MNLLEIAEEDPSFQTPRKTLVMIDRNANDNSRKPNSERAISTKVFDSAVAAHQRFLDDILRIRGIPRRGNRDLQQERPMLTGSGFEIDIFCPYSDRVHPSLSLVMTALGKGGFEIIWYWRPGCF